MPWDDVRLEKLKALNDQGLSATQIAALIGGGITRNAVVSKLDRLGIGMKTGKSFRDVSAPATRAPQAPQVKRAPYLHNGHNARGGIGKAVITGNGAVRIASAACAPLKGMVRPAGPKSAPLHQLRASQCRMWVGDAAEDLGADSLFCGEPKAGEGPYCPRCASSAYDRAPGKGRPSAGELTKNLRRYL